MKKLPVDISKLLKSGKVIMPGDAGQSPFGRPGDLVDYTKEVQIVPNTWGLITGLNLFDPFPVSTTIIAVEVTEHGIYVLPETTRGGPASEAEGEETGTVLFQIPNFKHSDYIYPADVQDKRVPGSMEPDTMTRERAKKLELARKKHALTKEFMLMGAIKGQVIAGKNRVITNMYSKFEVTQKVVGLSLASDTTNVNARLRQVKDHIDQNMGMGSVMNTGIKYVALLSTTLFDSFVGHAKIEKYYERAIDRPDKDVTRLDLSYDGFLHQGILFMKYPAVAPIKGVGNVSFIEDDTGYIFPTNVEDMFRVYYAPANHIDYVQTRGQELYTWQYNHEEGEWAKIKSESNPLPINTKPQAVVKIIKGDTPT